MPTSLSLPTERRVALLGRSLAGKSVLLRILTGLEAPDTGHVVAPLRLSPIANSSAPFDTRMTIADNIRYLARLYGVDAETLTLATVSYCRTDLPIQSPIAALPRNLWRALDIALVAVLPFDCYLLDHITNIETGIVSRYVASAMQRNAGVIFATSRIYDVREHADFVVVLHGKSLYPFDDVNEAIQFYDRQAA
jgi:capsular polysaccharide transport system ATP-binding protein